MAKKAKFEATKHPVLKMPTLADVEAVAASRHCTAEEAFSLLHRQRNLVIQRETNDPFHYGWEPPIWKVCRALLNLPFVDAAWEKQTGVAWEQWMEQMRTFLGFEQPVNVLLILGGNRGGKSEFAAKVMMQILRGTEAARVWPFHSKQDMSREYQQPLFWKFMDSELKKKDIRQRVTYVVYRQKTGFSDDKFVLPNKSECSYRFYRMDKYDAVEGGDVDGYWADELVPPDWVETLDLRIAERDGVGIVTFTPVKGYTPTVRYFGAGAQVMRESVAFLAPRDEGDKSTPRALGFESTEEMEEAHAQGRWSVPEACDRWLHGESGQPAVPAGRQFKMVPRVVKCVNPEYAVVYFHSSDNPYGKPHNVAKKLRNKVGPFVEERFYGIAHHTVSARFPRFSQRVHVVDAAAIPVVGDVVMLVDPAGGRNFVMKWYRVNREGVYLFREWPGSYAIPGQGVPGPWALPDGVKLDGRPGPAQATFGWGLLDYKEEIARLEGWEPLNQEDLVPARKRQAVIDWQPGHQTREKVAVRMLDSRAATSPRVENDRPKTLLTDFEEIGLWFELTPGDDIADGIQAINNALAYDPERPLDYFNKPHYFVARDCLNSIYALETWTGQDGQKGATKDFIDLDRYLFRSGYGAFVSEGAMAGKPGGHY